MEHVVICHPEAPRLTWIRARFPDVAFDFLTDMERALGLADRCTAFVCSGRMLTAEAARRLFAAPRLRWVQLASAGMDKLEGVTRPPHVCVTRGGGINNTPVAEHALALILALQRQLPDAVRNQAQGLWGLDRHRFETLAGKHVVVLGFGEIGRTLARKLLALDAVVTGVSRNPAHMAGTRTAPAAQLLMVLPTADVLACVLPGGAGTHGLIGPPELALLPAHAILVNVGRGNSVDTEALLEALRSGRLAGAGLDVTDPEPLPRDHPLWRCSNVIITPHKAGRDHRQPERLAELVEVNLRRFLAGEPLLYMAAL